MERYHKIHIPAHVVAKWNDMTERNDHAGVLWEVACFFSYAEFKHEEFEKLADILAWVLRERDRHGYLTEAALKEKTDAYYKLKNLIGDGYGVQTLRKIHM